MTREKFVKNGDVSREDKTSLYKCNQQIYSSLHGTKMINDDIDILLLQDKWLGIFLEHMYKRILF